jgi:hypothetical protein
MPPIKTAEPQDTEGKTPKGALSKLMQLLAKQPQVEQVTQPDSTDLHVACVVRSATEDVKTGALRRVVAREFTGGHVTVHSVPDIDATSKKRSFLVVLFKKDPLA